MQFFEDTPNRLRRYFSEGLWDIYDGVEIERNSEITICDIALSDLPPMN